MDPRLYDVFGADTDPMQALDERLHTLLPERRAIVWESDATDFHFLYVSPEAADLFGYPVERWTEEPRFWTDIVVYPADRDDTTACYALCTGKGQDHDFIYRAVTADGKLRWLHDVVRVIKSRRGIATHLRGITIDVTDLMEGQN